MTTPRYLIGGGEKLTEEMTRPRRGFGDKAHPYTFAEAIERLSPQLREVERGLGVLSDLACPGDDAVIGVTLHPAYLAKSYYPAHLIDELRLRHLGSRAVHIVPSKVAAGEAERPQPAPLIYLSGKRGRLLEFAQMLPAWKPRDELVQNEFREIERVSLPDAERAKPLLGEDLDRPRALEIVLHADAEDGDYIVEGFADFVRSLGLDIDTDRRRQNSGLCFLPMYAPKRAVPDILQFSFLRALRSMPRVVPLDPAVRALIPSFRVALPDEDAAAPELKVAIFDGGLPDNHGLERWVSTKNVPGTGDPVPSAQAHGLVVDL